MKLAVLNENGKELRKLEVDDSVFGIQPNISVLHQAFVRQRNNNRGGNSKTKTRGEVQGSTRKIRAQKYTGRARAGGNRSPTRVGGGIAFGPRPRSYERDMPKKMRRLAIRSALSGKVADGELVVIDKFSMDTPKTKEILRLIDAVGLRRSALLVTAQPDRMVAASVRNLAKAKALPAAYLNVLDMMNHSGLLMTEDAVRVAEGLWGQKDRVDGVAKAPRRRSVKVEAPRAPAAPRRSRAEVKAEEPGPAPAAEAEEASAPVAEAVASETPVAEAAAEAPKPKRTRAPKAEKPAAPEATTDEAPKPRRTRAPKAQAPAEKPADDAAEAPKPKRAPRPKKTPEGE